jgi:hypothetical protein
VSTDSATLQLVEEECDLDLGLATTDGADSYDWEFSQVDTIESIELNAT